MSKLSKAFEGLTAIRAVVLTAAPSVANLPSELMAKAEDQLSRGAAEIASALFSGSAYVQYGHGHSVPAQANEPAQEQSAEHTPEQAPEHDHDGMER